MPRHHAFTSSHLQAPLPTFTQPRIRCSCVPRSDVTGLTASLMRQALPCHFRITTRDAASRSANLATGLTNRI